MFDLNPNIFHKSLNVYNYQITYKVGNDTFSKE